MCTGTIRWRQSLEDTPITLAVKVRGGLVTYESKTEAAQVILVTYESKTEAAREIEVAFDAACHPLEQANWPCSPADVSCVSPDRLFFCLILVTKSSAMWPNGGVVGPPWVAIIAYSGANVANRLGE